MDESKADRLASIKNKNTPNFIRKSSVTNFSNSPKDTLCLLYLDEKNIRSFSRIIYQLTCKLCTHNNSIYMFIGETSKTANKRLVEHWLATCNKNVNLSSIAEHFNLYHYSHILSKDKPLLSLKIIDRANSYTERKIKEAVWINKLKPNLNKNTGLELTY